MSLVCFVTAAAAASLCVRIKGAIPSMPERKAVLELLEEHPAIEENLSLPNEKVVANIKEGHPFAYGQNAPEGSLSEEKKVMSISISAE